MQLNQYLITAWRNLIRRKGANFLNILGLSVGLAGCLVIFLIEQHEWSYDRYQSNYRNIYQLVKNTRTAKGDNFHVSIPFEAVRALRQDYPQVRWAETFADDKEQVTVMKDAATTGAGKYIEEGIWYAGPELFGIFDLGYLTGNATVLEEPNTIVLCRSLADKYFGHWDKAMGQYLLLNNALTVRISGVITDPPATTDFPFRAVVSYKTFLANSRIWGLNDLSGWGWSISEHQVFALLPEKTDASAIDKSLPSVIAKYFTDDGTSKKTYFLHPLREVHFDTRFENNGDHVSSKTSLYTLGFVGVLILLMACINFVNLSTALAATRSKETGVRKVMGSSRLQLGLQVLADTCLVMMVALGISILLAQLSLPYLKYISPIEAPLHLLNGGTVLFLCGSLLVATLLSGVYPAFQLSRLNPIEAIQHRFSPTKFGGLSVRRVLVVLQFAFSQLLIIATLIAVSQMDYVSHADMGFNKESVLILQGNSDSVFRARQLAFKQELLAQKDVQAVSFAENTPVNGRHETNFSFDHIDADQPFYATLKYGDLDYARVFGLQMAAGHWYTTNDTLGEAVINETMAHRLGIRNVEKAMGRQIRIGDGPWRSIVGVVKDFKNNSLKEEIPANIILRNRGASTLTAIRLASNNPSRGVSAVETVWNRYYPEYAFNSSFLDERIDRFYRQEQRLSASYKVYTLLAILISCLGLYGLVSFMAVQRTKEVGIRKVLGASIGNIVYLFSREFTVLVVIAFLIAAPVAYYMMNNWLQGFVYRIHIGAGIFLATIIISICIAWLTVGWRSLRAALLNPVKSLRAE
jgi:putative ABC transport system permease protein